MMLIESGNVNRIEFGKSVRGLNWKLKESCSKTVQSFVQRYAVSETLAKIIYNRGIKTLEEAGDYLDPKLKNLIPNPFLLKDMDKAVKRIIEAICDREKICIFGDYDVDGATSSSLLRRFFRMLGQETDVYIPNRMTEGYGPNIEAFKKIKDRGVKLVITVDCGTVSFAPIKQAKELGLDVIVIDHHLSLAELPEADAVINPNRLDDGFPIKSIAAVTVAFLVVIAVRKILRDQEWFTRTGSPEPDLISLLDLVALGTVCDVMPLQGMNRALLVQGLKIMAQRNNIGIATLADTINLDSVFKAHHLGFVIGPRINAGGRVGEGMLGSNLLYTDSNQEALEIALKLNQLNEERKAIEAIAFGQAIRQIEEQNLHEMPIMFVKGSDWHIGILGILASKLKERYSKPAAVMLFKSGVIKGSARSIEGLDLGSALANAKSLGLLLEGGGHKMAGGFTVEEKKLQDFCDYIVEEFSKKPDVFSKARDLPIDSIISLSSINSQLVEMINRIQPFGNANPSPRFILYDVAVVSASIVGQEHVVAIVNEFRYNKSNIAQKTILFKGAGTELGQTILSSIGKKVNLVGYLQVNSLDINRIDFVIEDAAVK